MTAKHALRGIAAALLLIARGIPAEATPTYPTGTVYRFSVAVDTNGVVVWPSNFWINAQGQITNWQAVVYSLTNGAALGETALQPPATNALATALQPHATNTLAAAAAHAATAHAVTDQDGFRGGTFASATTGAALGRNSVSGSGGAIGDFSIAGSGGAVGELTVTSDGFAGGKQAWTTDDGLITGTPIDAIQLGTGGNAEPGSLQVYTHRLMNADGTIPPGRFGVEWQGITNLASSITVSNSFERPVYLYATGEVSVAFAGLRTPNPLYLVLRGPDSVSFPGAYIVGGGTWQTNQSNHFLVWTYGTNTFLNAITTSED